MCLWFPTGIEQWWVGDALKKLSLPVCIQIPKHTCTAMQSNNFFPHKTSPNHPSPNFQGKMSYLPPLPLHPCIHTHTHLHWKPELLNTTCHRHSWSTPQSLLWNDISYPSPVPDNYSIHGHQESITNSTKIWYIGGFNLQCNRLSRNIISTDARFWRIWFQLSSLSMMHTKAMNWWKHKNIIPDIMPLIWDVVFLLAEIIQFCW